MRVILYMAMTVNGFIAKEDDNTDWASEDDWKSFNQVAKSTGVMIIGSRTYEVMSSEQFLPDVLYIVVSSKNNGEKKTPRVEFINKSPQDILNLIAEKGHKEVCVAGGSQINSLFMKEGFIDEIYIDIEPLIFGKGIQLFKPDDFEYQLELLDTEKLNANLVQLHYKVNK